VELSSIAPATAQVSRRGQHRQVRSNIVRKCTSAYLLLRGRGRKMRTPPRPLEIFWRLRAAKDASARSSERTVTGSILLGTQTCSDGVLWSMVLLVVSESMVLSSIAPTGAL
jgi:hypothetical protein